MQKSESEHTESQLRQNSTNGSLMFMAAEIIKKGRNTERDNRLRNIDAMMDRVEGKIK